MKKFLVIGHRGAAGLAPENTIESFKKALEYKVDMVEFDVYKCKSGEIVVIHDEYVDRTTNGKGKVQELTLEQIKCLDIEKKHKIPTLEEVLDFIDARCMVDIELKGKGTAKIVAKIIKEYVKSGKYSYEDFWVTSFDKSEIEKFHEIMPKVVSSNLNQMCSLLSDSLLSPYLILSRQCITSQIISKAHNQNLLVLVYTVNDKKEIEKFQLMGVDGIFTDYPNLVR